MVAEKTVAVRLVARVDAYTAAMAKASAATGAFSASSQRNLIQVGSQMQTIGRRASMWLSLPIAAAGAFAVKAASDWESSWAGVTKTVDGTAAQMADLEAGLRGMAKELPATHAEIAAVAEAAGALGVAAPDIEQFTRVMIDLGETTNLSADEAATSIAQMMNVMQTAPDDVDNLASTLVHLGNTGASTEAEILNMAQRIAGSGALIGLSEAEVLGFAAAMADLGINAELGGTAIQRVFSKMHTAVIQGGDALTGFANIAGVSASQFAATFEGDPARAVTMFFEGLQRIDAAGGDVITVLADMGISGELAKNVILRLMGAGDGLTETLDRSAAAWSSNTALTEEAQKRYETFAARLEIVRNKFVDLFIDLGTIALPVIERLVEGAGSMAEAFQRLPQPVQMAVGGFLALVAAVGPMAFVFGTAIKNLQTLHGLFALTVGSSNGLTRGLSSLGLAAGVAFVAWKILDEGHLNAGPHIQTTGEALKFATEQVIAESNAAAEGEAKIQGLALAHQALSMAISENADSALETAFANFNVPAEDTLAVMTSLERTSTRALTQIGMVADRLGLTHEQAHFFYSALTGYGQQTEAQMQMVADHLGISFEAVQETSNDMNLLTQFAEENKQEVADMADTYLDAAVRMGGVTYEAVLQAEAIAGSREEGTNAIRVFEEFVPILAELTAGEGDAAEGADGLWGSLGNLVMGGGEAGSVVDDLGSKAMLSADDFKALAGDVSVAGELVDEFGSKALLGADGSKTLAGDVEDAAGSFEEFEGVAGSSIDTLTLAQEAFNEAARAAGNFGSELDRLTGKEIGVTEALEDFHEWNLKFTDALADQDEELGHVNRSLAINTLEGQANRDLLAQQRDNILELAQARLEDGVAVDVVANEINTLVGQLGDSAVATQFNREEFEDLLFEWGLTPEQVKTTIVQAGMLTAQERLADLLAKYDDIPPEVATEIQTLIDHGMFRAAEARLAALEASRHTPVIAVAHTADAKRQLNSLTQTLFTKVVATTAGISRSAEGRYVPGPMISTLGEEGPEVVLPLTNPSRMAALLDDPRVFGPIAAAMGNLTPASGGGGSTSSGGGSVVYNVNVNMPPGSNGDDVVRALRKWERRRGPVPISTR